MLSDILKILNTGSYLSRAMLATRLNIPPEIIDEGINQLQRMGYIKEETTGENCLVSCASCPFAKNCQKEIIKTFKITEKGSRYLSMI